MPQKTECATVLRIEDQGDRVLLYTEEERRRMPAYYVIADPERGKCYAVGDTVVYEPCGFNFGFLPELDPNDDA